MGSHEQAIMGLESRAVTARVTKHFVTIFSTTCNSNTLTEIFLSTMLVRLQLSALVASCHLLITFETVCTQVRPDNMSGLIYF